MELVIRDESTDGRQVGESVLEFLTETITVGSFAPPIDNSSTTLGTNLNATQIETLPTINRQLQDFAREQRVQS